jgi:hypothetical protein
MQTICCFQETHLTDRKNIALGGRRFTKVMAPENRKK